MQTGFVRFIAALMAGCVAACATSPPPKPLTPEEQVRVDNDVGRILAPKLESRLKFRKDIEVSVYLRELATKLMAVTPRLKDAPIGVMIAEDREGKWRSYALPGVRVYLSVGLLKSVEFENELAAAIAFQLSHISRRHVLKRAELLFGPEISAIDGQNPDGLPGAGVVTPGSPFGNEEWEPDFFSGSGLFRYSIEDNLAAVDSAVEILYLAGFDPRGVVSLWTKHLSNPDRSPYSEKDLKTFLDRSHLAIANFAPLRNPIVRTKRFVAISKRIAKL